MASVEAIGMPEATQSDTVLSKHRRVPIEILLYAGATGIILGAYPLLIHSVESSDGNHPKPASTPITEFSAFSPLTKQADGVLLFTPKKQNPQAIPSPTMKANISYAR